MDVVGVEGIEEQLVERERWLLHPSASTDIDALLAEDFLEVGASARRWSRGEALELVAARRESGIGDYELSEISCRALGGRAQLLTYTIRSNGRTSLRASIWDEIDGRWQMVYHQGTPVPA